MERERILLSLCSIALLILLFVSMPVSSFSDQEPVYKVLNPRGYMGDVKLTPLAPRVADLNNKVVYLVVTTQEVTVTEALRKAGEALKKRFPNVQVVPKFKVTPYITDDPELWDEMAKNGHAFVYSAGSSSTGTYWASTWSSVLEKKGLPGVVFIYEKFQHILKETAQSKGVSLRWATKTFPPEKMTEERMQEAADMVVKALTEPLQDNEKRTGNYTPPKPSRYAMEGTYSQVQEEFYRQLWTDGLPIAPPTEEKVKEMLKGTKHLPDEIVSNSVWPEQWTATVEKVAINGVMAGCKPEYLPVLLAMLEAWSQQVHSNVRSSNSFSHMTVVNGPIRKEIDMNGDVYALGPGNQANATIGRALRLLMKNLGGAEPGVNLMGVQGNVSGYTFCFPENEEASPYEPLSVDLGYKRGQSTVTIFSGGWSHVGNYNEDTDLLRFTNAVAHFEWPQGLTVLLSPLAAKRFAERGLTKKELRDYFWKNATLSLKELKADYHWEMLIKPNIQGKVLYGDTNLWPKELLTLPDEAMVQVYPRKYVNVIVVGSEVNPMVQGWKFAMPSTASVDKWR